MCKHL